MKTLGNTRRIIALTLMNCAFCVPVNAQTTWIGGGGDNDWNNVGNWDVEIPSAFVSGTIPSSFTVDYDTPMVAPNIFGLTLGGALSITTNGFNIDPLGGTAPLSVLNGGNLVVSSDGVVTITNAGAFRIMDRNARMAVNGGTLLLQNNFGAVTVGEGGNVSATYLTNNAGAITVDQSFQLRGRYTGFYMNGGTLDLLSGGGVFESSNDQERRFQISGGTANLVDFSITRTSSGGGLRIDDGIVTATSLRVGVWNSKAYSDVYGGSLTVGGDFFVCDRTNGATSGDRRIRFFVRGGEVTSTSSNGIVIANQSNGGSASYSTIGGLLEVRDVGP